MAGSAKEMKSPHEYRIIAYEPEGCFKPNTLSVRSSAAVGEREDFFWVELERPLFEDADETEGKFVLLAARHHGYSLKDISYLPLHVYICGAQDARLILEEHLDAEEVSILAWALLLDADDARVDLTEILESMQNTMGNVHYINPVKQ